MVLGEDLPVFHSTRFLPAMLLATSMVAGCASTRPPAPDPGVDESKLGSLYVYHLSDSGFAKSMGVLALRRALIYIDNTEPFSLPSGHHARVMLEPGYHTVYAKTSIYGMPGMPIGKQQIEVRAGEVHYLHYFEQGEGGFVVQRFVQQDAAVGAKAVASTKSAAK